MRALFVASWLWVLAGCMPYVPTRECARAWWGQVTRRPWFRGF